WNFGRSNPKIDICPPGFVGWQHTALRFPLTECFDIHRTILPALHTNDPLISHLVGIDSPTPASIKYLKPISDEESLSNLSHQGDDIWMILLLIDGHYYVYRSFFAIPNLSNSRGEPTNAIFGFTKTLRLMLKHLQPRLGAVVWDEGVPQRRIKLQPA